LIDIDDKIMLGEALLIVPFSPDQKSVQLDSRKMQVGITIQV
jgi:hypothetical protein